LLSRVLCIPSNQPLELSERHKHRQTIVIVKKQKKFYLPGTQCQEFYLRLGEGELLLRLSLEMLLPLRCLKNICSTNNTAGSAFTFLGGLGDREYDESDLPRLNGVNFITFEEKLIWNVNEGDDEAGENGYDDVEVVAFFQEGFLAAL
ncbi:Os01g0959050, partial [Oryza sativa Japonica Group]